MEFEIRRYVPLLVFFFSSLPWAIQAQPSVRPGDPRQVREEGLEGGADDDTAPVDLLLPFADDETSDDYDLLGAIEVDFEDDFQFNIYGHITAAYMDRPRPRASFDLGPIDLFGTAELSEKTRALSEVMVMVSPAGVPMVRPARFYIEHRFAEWLQVTIGRMHTPMGFYNVSYPHGGTLYQLGTERPRLMAMNMGTEMLPSHTTGVQVAGNKKLVGDSTLEWHFSVGNGGNSLVPDMNLWKSVAGRLELEVFTDLKVGLSGYFDRIPKGDGARNVDELIAMVYLAYISYPWHVDIEYTYLEHRTRNDIYLLRGGFAEFAYGLGDLTPFGRFEYVERDAGDPVFQRQPGAPRPVKINRVSLGLRYRLNERAVAKVEYRRDFQEKLNRAALQISFGL